VRQLTDTSGAIVLARGRHLRHGNQAARQWRRLLAQVLRLIGAAPTKQAGSIRIL